MGAELVTDREKKTPATKTASLLVKRWRLNATDSALKLLSFLVQMLFLVYY